jgi:UDP-GlcNAc3NAcA epimerase
MLKVATVVGARPQFIKAAVISRLIRGEYITRFSECLIHTGQHYDDNMSAVFFRDMGIPEPDVNLGVGSGTHGQQTAHMLAALESVLLREEPGCVIVYGDTNSTLAGALAAAKLGIPVAHVEAGMRSFNRRMPEELNRVVADHLSTHLFCPSDVGQLNLEREGITGGVVVGDVMYDARLYYSRLAPAGGSWQPPGGASRPFYLLTLHRAENTDDPHRLGVIIETLNSLDDYQGVFPVHPRTRAVLERLRLNLRSHIRLIEPVGFLEMLRLEEECDFVVTDSGGVQKEAYFSRKPCITLRDETEWVETVESGWNTLVGAETVRIREAFVNVKAPRGWKPFYGEGRAGQAILENLEQNLSKKEESS